MVAGWQVTRELLAIVYEHVVPKVRGVPVNDDLCHDIVLFSATFNDFAGGVLIGIELPYLNQCF